MTVSHHVFQNSSLASVIVGLIQVVFTAVAALIMDKAGRKILLIISGIIAVYYMHWFLDDPTLVTCNENTALCEVYHVRRVSSILI